MTIHLRHRRSFHATGSMTTDSGLTIDVRLTQEHSTTVTTGVAEAYLDGLLIGRLDYSIDAAGAVSVGEIAVRRAYRRQGVGSALVAFLRRYKIVLEDFTASRGMSTLGRQFVKSNPCARGAENE